MPLNTNLDEIARLLGGDVSGDRVRCPGPGHSSRDRSLSVRLSATAPDGFVVNSFAGDDWRMCKTYVLGRLGRKTLKPAANEPRRGQSSALAVTADKGKAAASPLAKATTHDDELVSPIPRNAPPPPRQHRAFGKAVQRYHYRDARGANLFFILRFEPPGGTKQFLPLTLWRDASGAYVWRWRAAPSPRPLYGLCRLAADPEASVIVCEGEKATVAAASIFPDRVAVTSPGGAQGAAVADWTPLTGRSVRIWPDADKAGAAYANTVAGLISGLAEDVEIVDAIALASLSPKGGTRKARDKWDAADALPEWRKNLPLLRRAMRHFSRPFSPPEVAGEKTKITLEPFDSIRIAERTEWVVKRILPKRGVAALYGRYGAFKSFVAFDIAMHVALGWDWAGRRVTQSPVVYLCAEGAAGFRKRKMGFEEACGGLPPDVPFHLIDAAPNLGAVDGDLDKLRAAIEGAGVAPGLIVVDTLAATLHGADENGSGMVQFLANANALSSGFHCLVLVVHHVGHAEDKRLRGHSSFGGAADAIMLCERQGYGLETRLTLQKAKDEASNLCFAAALSRVVIGQDEDGEEISTLVVDSVEDAGANLAGAGQRPASGNSRTLLEVVTELVDEVGESIRPSRGEPAVRAAHDEVVRERFYQRLAEKAQPHEDPEKLAERQRKAFNRAVKATNESGEIKTAMIDDRRFVWLPAETGTAGRP